MPVDLSASIYAEYKRARKRAEEAERRAAYGEAAIAYQQSAELMRKYASYARDATIRNQRLHRAEALGNLAKKYKKVGVNRKSASEKKLPQSDTGVGEDDYDGIVMGLIQKTNLKWDDIGGLQEVKDAIKTTYGLAMARKPKNVQISAWRNLLLYGPPGTGKTLLAAATAGNLDATFFNVKVSNLLSKYFGESTKLISALYHAARRLTPSVVFTDEFDSLTPPRGGSESGAERRIVSTLLAELDGLANKEEDSFVLTIAATNVPWLLDSAILSRFQRRVYVPLPDAETRRAILEIQINRRGHKSKCSIDELVKRTQGYSGREIQQICQIAEERMTQRANPNLLAIVDQGGASTSAYQLRVQPLSQADFEVAFDLVKPVTDARALKKFDDWQKKVEA
jgi:katanin p60 ATPase-containing subunit A1